MSKLRERYLNFAVDWMNMPHDIAAQLTCNGSNNVYRLGIIGSGQLYDHACIRNFLVNISDVSSRCGFQVSFSEKVQLMTDVTVLGAVRIYSDSQVGLIELNESTISIQLDNKEFQSGVSLNKSIQISTSMGAKAVCNEQASRMLC